MDRDDSTAWEAARARIEAEFGEPITVDGLTRHWQIFQRKKGHRHSTDDLVTGWYALEIARGLPLPPIQRTLDLGTGIGTVGMLVLSRLAPEARLTCIEAQEISYRLLKENLRGNGIETRVRAIHGDLRDLDLGERFPLVTGSPPYFDVGAGIVPADSQKAHARFELRGDVGDYARAAVRHLEPDGRFVFCFPYPQIARAIAAVRKSGLVVLTQRDVVPREGLPPLFSVFACKPGEGGALVLEDPFVVREKDGAHTRAMHDLRASFGW